MYVRIHSMYLSIIILLVQGLDSGCFGMADLADMASVD